MSDTKRVHRKPVTEIIPVDELPDDVPRKSSGGRGGGSKWVNLLREVAATSNGGWVQVVKYTNRQGAATALKTMQERGLGEGFEFAVRKVQDEDTGEVVSVLYARTTEDYDEQIVEDDELDTDDNEEYDYEDED